jgi:hypothetical protein
VLHLSLSSGRTMRLPLFVYIGVGGVGGKSHKPI